MATFSYDQLRSIWLAAGGPGLMADVAAAVALAESGGCQYALAGPADVRPVKECVYRPTTQENSFGLWQINIQGNPGFAGRNLFDPKVNAETAVELATHGRGWDNWSTYTNGSYRQYLGGAHSPPGTQGGGYPTEVFTPRLHLPPSPDDKALKFPVDSNPLVAWHHLTTTLGVTLPTTTRRAELARRRFVGAVRWRSRV